MKIATQPLDRQIVFETDRLRVIWQDADTDVIFITFNELGLLKTGDVFWGFELFAKAGVSSIGIVTTEPNWYPQEDMKLAIEVINRKTSGRRVITYGHSQGGYGALKFGSALKADMGVAFCPQWSITPEAVGAFDSRFVHYYQSPWRNGLPIESEDLPDKSFVFYDPLNNTDAKHVDLIAHLGPVEKIKVPFTGHETVRIVSEGGISNDLIALFCSDGKPKGTQMRTLLRRARSRSKTYNSNLLKALLEKAPLRQNCLDEFEKTNSNNARMIKLCRAVDGGDLSRATTLLLTCADAEILEMGAVNVWSTFRSGKFIEGEKRLARILIERFPHNAFLRLHAVNSYIEVGMHDKALSELIRVIADLDVSDHMNHVRMFAKSLAKTSMP